MPSNSNDSLVCTILAAHVAALRDRIDTGATVELLWHAADLMAELSRLVVELAARQAVADPALDARCAAATSAEVEVSRSFEELAFLQAQHQDFGRQTADCVVQALARLAIGAGAGESRLSVEDLAAMYVSKEQREVHEAVTGGLGVDSMGGLPPAPNDQAFAAVEGGAPGDLDLGSAHDLEPRWTEPDLADPDAAETANRGTARDLDTAMRLFGAAIVDQVDTSVTAVLSENHQMREMASEMATAAAQAKDQFKAAMSRSGDAEGGIEQLNALSGELTGSIQVIGLEVQRSIATVQEATDQANATRDCVQTMASLSRGVSDMVQMIDAIARQSKMLAFNATIEAARAGEEGRGFGVVAREMSQLSSQTAEATQTIRAKIEEMTDMVARSVASLLALVGAIARVDTASASIGQAIGEQDILVEQVSTSLESMRGAVAALSREIRESAQLAANGGMLAEMVLETANSVDALVVGLKGKLDNIGAGLGSVAAAAGPEAGSSDSARHQGLAA